MVPQALAALHQAEAEVLRRQLSSPPAVISAAASVVDDPTSSALIATAGEVVYLRAEPATLLRRVALDPPRPLPGAATEVLPVLDARRRPLYEQLATVTIDVDDEKIGRAHV